MKAKGTFRKLEMGARALETSAATPSGREFRATPPP